MGLRRDLTAGSSTELCRELGPPPITLGPERLLRGLFILSQLQGARKFPRTGCRISKKRRRRHQPPRPSLPANVKDFQFGHEHFHLFEGDEALSHFGPIYLRQIVWLEGFAYTPQDISYALG
jgi:hypothetical protein